MAPAAEENPSLITALHQRYEFVTRVGEAVNDTTLAARGASLSHLSEGDMVAEGQTLSREADALQAALLHQVPDTWRDALILQFHVLNACDRAVLSTPRDEAHCERLQLAIDHILAFIGDELGHLGEGLDSELTTQLQRVRRQRGIRAGSEA